MVIVRSNSKSQRYTIFILVRVMMEQGVRMMTAGGVEERIDS